MSRIGVIGIGNVLTGDDAVGPYAVRVLEATWAFPEDVEVIDAGTPGVDLTAYLAEYEAVVIVDAVKARGAPGELRLYDKEALVRKSPVLAMSAHEPGVREAIMNADFMGVAPATIRLVGVIPGHVDLGLDLSPAVKAALPQVVDRVLEELRALGVEPRERVPPREPDLWWTRRPGA